METGKVLAVMFDRLYTLRNQLIHGGATWASSINRSQVEHGADILRELVPVIISLMMDEPERFRSDPCYPVMD